MQSSDQSIQSKFDRVFNNSESQEDVFAFISPAINQFIKGFSCTIFAYGQTGSGKTHTMFGKGWDDIADPEGVLNSDFSGIVPRTINQVFGNENLANCTVYTSFLQIYNEKIFDLLGKDHGKTLQIRESKLYGIFVEGLAEFVVQSKEDCAALLNRGNSLKASRQTKLNQQSSRSHTIFQMQVESNVANKKGNLKSSKLSLCDLAGSEKYDKEGIMTSIHIKEMTQINKSLSTLGKVIQELGKKKSLHIPYRDSKLTRLLQDCLGKTSKTVLIATISPSSDFVDETISTLKFADRAKQVMIRSKKNEVSALSNEIVTKLQKEISHLKSLLGLRNKRGIEELHKKIENLTQENKVLKRKATLITIDEVQRLRMENKLLRLELQNMGIVQGSGDPFKDSFQTTTSNLKANETSKPEIAESDSEVQNIKSSDRKEFVHLSVSPIAIARSQMNITKSSLDFQKEMKMRIKIKNSQQFSQQMLNLRQNNKSSQNIPSDKGLKLVQTRIQRITEMERTKKIKFKEELERLEASRVRDQLKLKKLTQIKAENLQDMFKRKKLLTEKFQNNTIE